MISTRLLDNVKKAEGFSATVYKCTQGFNTIGYGYNLDSGMAQDEAEALLRIRLDKAYTAVVQRYPRFQYEPQAVQEAITEMAYQLGVGGCFGFKNMWQAIENGDYKAAADAMRDSKWYHQTTSRVERLAKAVESVA